MRRFFGTAQRDIERHGVRHVVINSHGITLRQLAMMWREPGVAWVEQAKNPPNRSIRLIRGTTLAGCGFDGSAYPQKTSAQEPSAQEKREDGKIDCRHRPADSERGTAQRPDTVRHDDGPTSPKDKTKR